MTEPGRADLLIANAAELLTCAADATDAIGRLPGGSVAIAGERIVAVGDGESVAAAVDTTSARVVDATGKVVLPGFVDCHTHVLFGGSRVEEYTVRAAGGDVEPLRERGVPVGIAGTVAATRALDVDELVARALPRLDEMLRAGTTTAESKSGYALTVEGELRMLEANRRLQTLQTVEIVSTFLGAHALPGDVPREDYVARVVEEMIPRVAVEKLAAFCDVYCEEGYFTIAEARRILEAGLTHGLRPKLHLDQYSHTGAAAMAAELRCVSVDHLNYTTAPEMARLGQHGVTGVVMPGIDFATAHPRPVDCRVPLDQDLPLALATDICPGCWLPSMQLVIVLACRLHHLPVAAAIRAATLGAARAIGRDTDVGSLEVGKLADVLVLDIARHEELAYRIGHNAVETVIKRGAVVADRTA
jgi:imidazolonepropionase